MKIYVLVKCITYDSRGAIGEICDVQIFPTKDKAKAVIQKHINTKIRYSCLRKENIRENETANKNDYYYEVNYDAYDGDGNNDHYQWQIREFELKEDKQ